VLRAGIFVAASAAIALLTHKSLRSVRCRHGLYRFFAFELVLAIILLNAPLWFRDMLSIRQLISSFLLTVSLGLVIVALRLVLRIGRPMSHAPSGTNLRFENTTVLVDVGVYRFIRHPMYTSVLALGWGAFLKHPTVVSLSLALGASGFLVATVMVEERENLERFGESYAAYMKSTRRFIPFLI
jgi:protein-S-isoprenylcysteine O-methyltransferase Ste14